MVSTPAQATPIWNRQRRDHGARMLVGTRMNPLTMMLARMQLLQRAAPRNRIAGANYTLRGARGLTTRPATSGEASWRLVEYGSHGDVRVRWVSRRERTRHIA